VAALKEDLNKPMMESISFESEYNRNVTRSCLYDLDSWVADEYVEKNLVTLLDTTYIHREPFGVCLVMGAWNYPVVSSSFFYFFLV
jgi:acyl-CoA reductase-like NAD-dependent aldehyde dehydrogenase